jgi:hypothetical protein
MEPVVGTSRRAEQLTLRLVAAGVLAWKRALPNPSHAREPQVGGYTTCAVPCRAALAATLLRGTPARVNTHHDQC